MARDWAVGVGGEKAWEGSNGLVLIGWYDSGN